jgi:formate dehydrogenase subunit delta
MDIKRLVGMANDIARFYTAEPDREVALDEIASHITRFWDPRMRRALAEHVANGGEGLADLAREAAKRVRVPAGSVL